MLHLILGRAGSGKTARIIEAIRQRVTEKKGQNIYIVPEQYSHEAERELLRAAGDSVSLYAEVLSFTRLAHTLARELGDSARVYTDKGGRSLQMALALSQCAPMLSVYGGARQQIETIHPLLSALDELRYGCVDSEQLRAAALQSEGQLRQKLTDLALLQETMDALGERSGADPLTRLDVLADNIPRSELLRGGQVYIDGFTDFTVQERRIIRQLWLCGDVTVCLTCGDIDGEVPEEFAPAVRTARALRQSALEDAVPVKVELIPAAAGDTPLHFLEENLFSYTDERRSAEGKIRLLTANTMAEECEIAAGEVLRLVREEGCRWRDIAVAVRGFEEYQGTLESTFARFGIPLYTAVRTDVLQKPLPALTLSAFAVISGGWSYEDMFSCLKTGLAPLSREECDELENYVLRWDIHGGAWTAERPWAQHPDGFNREYTDEVNARLAKLDMLRRRVAAPLKKLWEDGKKAGTAREQCRALADFWEGISLAERLDERAGELRSLGRTQDAEETLQLWDKAAEALEQCAHVLGDTPMEQEEFARLFRLLLSEYDVGTIPVAVDRLAAGDLDRMRRRSLRHLLILGCTDERLPRIGSDTGVFTASERLALRSLDVEVEDGDDALEREFSLIYNVITLPSETLTLLRPLYGSDGSEQRPSFVTERAAKLFGLKEEHGDVTGARSSARSGVLELAAGGNEEAAEVLSEDAEAEETLARLRLAARYTRGSLSRESVSALYGKEPRISASQSDSFAACKFQYFLRYGLRAKEREKSGIDAPQMGTFLHYVLENCAREATERGGFAVLGDEEIREMAGRYTDAYIHEQMNDFREKSRRFVYLFRRLQQTVEQVVLDTAEELRRGDFVPLDFELSFNDGTDMAPLRIGEGEEALQLIGQVDRVDGWEKDGKLYLRVMDYKTGKKEFSFADVWNGMGLQMLLYLSTLEREGEARYGKPVESAGVLYIPARDEYVKAANDLSDGEIEKERAKTRHRSGLLLNDEAVLEAMEHGENGYLYLPVSRSRLNADALASAEQLGTLSRFVEELLGEMAGELRRGCIAADPWYKGENEGACVYCSYYDACHFDEEHEEKRVRFNLKAPEFWAKLEEREGRA